MNAEQYLERIENKRLNSTPLYSKKEMIDFAEKYAKQLTLTDVVMPKGTLCDLDGKQVMVKFKVTKYIPKIFIEDI